ncbi:uncharacterized protein DDB_G0285291 isoform X2 [Copidosoma floridanum]|uniref:uncharacterized protein DDB_G0285291 isoform X2 n=1 Tax=Copidosoma floridanum TaxID=29053 RepID=UPI0006C97F70|nr:uncharacterized protein DDB_G0285291 isoform X2 [Copidosoma floridanum]
MSTRSRQNQNFIGGTPQRNQFGGQQYQGPNYNNHGNYQGGHNQQNAFKQQGVGTPYKQQQQQQQPQQLQTPQRNTQLAKQQQPPNPQQLQPQQQQQQMPQAQRLKPILKSSATTNTQQSQNQAFNQQSPAQQQHKPLPSSVNNGTNLNEAPESMDSSDVQDVPKWKRKGPVKVNKKLKRLRLNQRLRKTLQPKNAIMVLNEMKTGVHFTFPEQQSSLPSSLFLVHAEIDGKTYVGQGVSKPLARQNAAENALKSLLLEKMTAAAMKASVDAENEGNTNSSQVSGEENENKEGGEGNNAEIHSEDPNEIPWSSLASFALYKLFLEWQNQGTVVPVPRPGLSPGKVKKDITKPITPKELPPNPISIHPVMLLNQMKPGLIYTEVNRVGNPPNITFTLGVEIDGQEYTGTAKNKKDAKKFAAKAALHALYSLVYPEEAQSSEDISMG